MIGKTGVERQYNEMLTGTDGQRQVVVDSHGIERQVIGLKEAVPGKPLRLTIDLDLQVVAELAMEGRKGRGGGARSAQRRGAGHGQPARLRPRPIRRRDPVAATGRSCSTTRTIAHAEPRHPGGVRPGLDLQADHGDGGPGRRRDGRELSPSFCPGGATFYGRYFACHLKGGHGTVDLHKAIVQSCDVYFYNLGNRLGIDKIAEYAEMCGLGKKTGIDLPNEAEGLVPSSRWKIRTTREKWYAGETISVSIGQGALTVTPLQLANAIGGLAMGGVWYTPHVVADPARRENPRRVEFKPENLAKVVNGMYGVVNEGGTGEAGAGSRAIEICGKTGTAQLASNEVLKGTSLGQEMKDNAWFVGFAPRQNPEIVVVALVEGGLHGATAAAPVARDMIKTYFDKKSKSAPQQLLARRPGLERTGNRQGHARVWRSTGPSRDLDWRCCC